MKPVYLITIFLLISCHLFQKEKKYFEIIAKSGLILRSGPGQNYNKITTLPINTSGIINEFIGPTTYIQGKKGLWLKVETEQLNGYIFSGFAIIHENIESLNQSRNYKSFPKFKGIFPFTNSDLTKEEFTKQFLEKFIVFESDLTPETKIILDNDLYKIDLISAKSEYSDYQTIFVLNKKEKLNYIPDIKNLHPTSLAENSKIITGLEYTCYNCCAMPTDTIGILAENKIYTLPIPLNDTLASCDFEGQVKKDFSQLRITNKNEIIIHKTIYDCSTDPKCSQAGAENNCKPTKVFSDTFILIENPYSNPNVFEFDASVVPKNILMQFKTGRAAITNKNLD
ncbi:SH3 domain-containing protein [Leptospira bandrabouensis]|uniref:SH3 domain-containing protein n=1 Tax=Leptospira bandrabouensis TaxID=2484903 RepID=A0A6H3NP73_9LEPT|nr:SH3 domain-containing protein [Leptospira bandrabouensis]TGN11622.1 SH3 domain-containing protein [Leptospira bandrabouensis]